MICMYLFICITLLRPIFAAMDELSGATHVAMHLCQSAPKPLTVCSACPRGLVSITTYEGARFKLFGSEDYQQPADKALMTCLDTPYCNMLALYKQVGYLEAIVPVARCHVVSPCTFDDHLNHQLLL